MNMLGSITSSQRRTGIRMVIYGMEKQGKSTLACSSPNPLLIPLEMGYAGINVPIVPNIEHYNQVMALLDEIMTAVSHGAFQFQSLVFDSATALERMLHQAVLESDPGWAKGNRKAITLESAHGGYGKARLYALDLWNAFLQKCDWLSQAGINIVITSHAFAAKVIDPAFGEFDQWNILLYSPKNNKSYGARELICQWADCVGFLHTPFYTSEAKDSSLVKAISANKGRVLAVNYAPSWVAGNRYRLTTDGIQIPPEKGWNSLAHAIYSTCGLDYYAR